MSNTHTHRLLTSKYKLAMPNWVRTRIITTSYHRIFGAAVKNMHSTNSRAHTKNIYTLKIDFCIHFFFIYHQSIAWNINIFEQTMFRHALYANTMKTKQEIFHYNQITTQLLTVAAFFFGCCCDSIFQKLVWNLNVLYCFQCNLVPDVLSTA